MSRWVAGQVRLRQIVFAGELIRQASWPPSGPPATRNDRLRLTTQDGVDLGCGREDDFCIAGDGNRLKRTAFRRTGLLPAEVLDLAKPGR
jgi:hypothetical protein